MILHKTQKKSPVTSRKQYLSGINKAYGEEFQSLDIYKEEKNFKRILSNIQLKDVICSINNANEIRKSNAQNLKNSYVKNGKFEYYTENPDITINFCIEQILK